MLSASMKLLVYLFQMLFVQDVFADSIAYPSSDAIVSQNGEFIYVRWVGNDEKLTIRNMEGVRIDDPHSFSKTDFPENGLYELKSKKFLWKIKTENKLNYEEEPVGRPFDDGRFVYVSGPWASDLYDVAFSIYEFGNLKDTFYIRSFCRSTESFVRTSSHFFWARSFEVDGAKGEVRFEACGDYHVIKVDSRFNFLWIYRDVVFVVLILVFIVLARLNYVRSRKLLEQGDISLK